MILVVDASVALKWFLHIRDNESDSDRALAILAGIDDGRIQLAQPPHFIAEVAAVLAREKAEESQLVHAPAIYATAIRLSIRYRHHLFDTLYHAAALHTPGATLVTADRRYYDQAKDIGQITWLADFNFAA